MPFLDPAREWVSLAAGPAPASNPLQGFVPYAGAYTAAPYSLEWFYIPVSAVVTGPGAYDWSSLESQLNAVASRGHQATFRFYLDYPGKPSGVPKYLLGAGLTTRPYDDHDNQGISVAPDYDDPRLITELENLISALGARYDGDPRIGFVQMGLLGFWGEWHTFPHEEWFAASSTQQQVLRAYTQAFTKTKLLVRNPGPSNSSLNVGYHDDSFAAETLPGTGWHFVDRLRQAGATEKWLTQPIGGELRGEIQKCIFDVTMRCPVVDEGAGNDFPGSVKATHVSWLLNQYAFEPGYKGIARNNALAASQSLGYRFQATSASVSHEPDKGQSELRVIVRNIGIAPFYYDWPVQIAAVSGAGKIVKTWATPWQLTALKPGMSLQWKTLLDTGGLAHGDYTLLMQPANPLASGVPLRFANALQDRTVRGWLTLGRISLPASSGQSRPELNTAVRGLEIQASSGPAPVDTALGPSTAK